MTLIVEDGSMPAGANTYISQADATTYHTTYGNTAWGTYSSDQQIQALITATKALEVLYGPNYRGMLVPTTTQSLLFPRYPFYDAYLLLRLQFTIPTELKQAECEIALMVLQGKNVFPQPNQQAFLKNEAIKAGDFGRTYTYAQIPDLEKFVNFRKVDLILYPILRKKNQSWGLGK